MKSNLTDQEIERIIERGHKHMNRSNEKIEKTEDEKFFDAKRVASKIISPDDFFKSIALDILSEIIYRNNGTSEGIVWEEITIEYIMELSKSSYTKILSNLREKDLMSVLYVINEAIER